MSLKKTFVVNTFKECNGMPKYAKIVGAYSWVIRNPRVKFKLNPSPKNI